MPASVRTAGEFSRALVELREGRGLSIRSLARETGIPSATLGGYFAGRHLPPLTQPEILATLLTALGIEPADLPEWRQALRRARQAPRARPSLPNPYRGLERFDIADAALFFGREELAAQLLDELERVTATSERWITLVGASGSGKSSLMRAGVLAAVRADGRSVLALTAGELDPVAVAAIGTDGVPLVLGVDQFEELFAPQIDPAHREAVLEALVSLATRTDAPVVVMVAVRADHFGNCVDEPVLRPLLSRAQVVVGPMSEDELVAAVREPAQRSGRVVEPELVSLVLDEAAPSQERGAAVLPLASHAMRVTWDRAGETLTARDYLAAGGLAGAIRETAEAAWAELDVESQDTARQLFTRLVVIADEGRVMKRRRSLSDVEDARGVAEAFVRQRILTISEDTVEVSHEIVFRAWPRLAGWIDEQTDILRLLHRLAARAQNWDENGRSEADLLSGSVLDAVEEGVAGGGLLPSALTELQREFVELSRAARERIKRQERGRRRRLSAALAVACVLALVTTVLSVYLIGAVDDANNAKRNAVEARNSALSRQVALEASDLASANMAVARQLALASYRISPTVEARSALLETSSRAAVTRLLGPAGSMRAVVSPDGALVATAGGDSAAHFYRRDPADPATAPTAGAIVPAAADAGELYAGEFSPDGTLFAMGGAGGSVTVVDVGDPDRPSVWKQTLTGPKSAVQGLRFSRDGTELAAATSDPALFRWRLRDGSATALPTLDTGFDGSVQSVDYGPRSLVATGSTDGYVRLWRESAAGALRLDTELRVGDSSDYVYSVAFDPAGDRLAAATKSNAVQLWRLDAAGTAHRLPAQTGLPAQVNSVAYSRDGSLLGAAASGGYGVVWRTSDMQEVETLAGPSNFTSIAFTPDSDAVVTGGIDGTTQVTQLSSGTLPPYDGTVWSLGYRPDGVRLYAGVGSPQAQVAAIDTRLPLAPAETSETYSFPGDAVLDGTSALSSSGVLVAGSDSGPLAVFRTAADGAPRPRQLLPVADQLTENVASSPDGSYVAGASDDGHVDVYRLAPSGRATLVTRIDTKSLPLGLSFTPTSDAVAVATADHHVTLYSLDAPARTISAVTDFDNYVYAVAFTPDSHWMVAAGADREIRMWDVTDLAHPRAVGAPARGPQNTIYTLTFDPTASLLAAGSSDGSLWLWRVSGANLRLFARLDNLGAHVNSVAFDPRGGVVAGAGTDGLVSLWSTEVDPTAAEVCRTAGSPLTRAEWAEYVPGASYRPPCP